MEAFTFIHVCTNYLKDKVNCFGCTIKLIQLPIHAVSRTETVNLLLGNNDCTCVEMDCQGALNVTISNPDPNEVDIICPVYGDTCYSPEICHSFIGIPFFNICETSMSENSKCKLNLCFRNVSEALNNTRLDFFISEKVICDTTDTVYTARTYIRSFDIRGELIDYYSCHGSGPYLILS